MIKRKADGCYVARMFWAIILDSISSAIVKYRDFIGSFIKAKIMGLSTPGAVNLATKYHISVSS